MSPRATHATRCLKKGDITNRLNRMQNMLKEFGSMACMSPVLEKANLIGEAPGGCGADIAVTCPLSDVYARLADEMSPADHYAAAELQV